MNVTSGDLWKSDSGRFAEFSRTRCGIFSRTALGARSNLQHDPCRARRGSGTWQLLMPSRPADGERPRSFSRGRCGPTPRNTSGAAHEAQARSFSLIQCASDECRYRRALVRRGEPEEAVRVAPRATCDGTPGRLPPAARARPARPAATRSSRCLGLDAKMTGPSRPARC
jgi:hypothetical protein